MVMGGGGGGEGWFGFGYWCGGSGGLMDEGLGEWMGRVSWGGLGGWRRDCLGVRVSCVESDFYR